MKILIAGDTHGSVPAIKRISEMALKTGAREVWQCGDFGYWPRLNYGMDFILSTKYLPVPLFFADGNHEDHSRLDHDADEPYKVAVNTYYVPRGHTRTIPVRLCDCEEGAECGDGCSVVQRRIMFFGGARSVDRTWRTEGWTWFHSELPTTRQFERAYLEAERGVDVVIAHDSPASVDYGYPPAHLSGWPVEDIEIGENFRQRLQSFVDIAKPTYWFNGHHHQRKVVRSNETTIWSLGESTQNTENWIVLLDLRDMTVENVYY